MKKIVTFVLLLCMVLSFGACGNNESPTPEITLQEVYDAGKTLYALLGDHESVYYQVISNGTLVEEKYLSRQYSYSYSGPEFMNLGFEYAELITDHAEYCYFDGLCLFSITLTQDGIMDSKESFATEGEDFFVSEAMLDDTFVVTEEDGFIIVACTSDMDDITLMGEGIVSCVETYTIDAETREMVMVKTVYTYEDGATEEGVITITRDAEMPERMKELLAYDQTTAAMRTVTIVSNPGAENEKTESVQVPCGLQLGLSPYWEIEEPFAVYADAACTQTFEEDWDVNADLTIYVKWGE